MIFPKIKFLYSPIYDDVLTEYEGKRFNENQKKEVENYIQKLQIKWREVEKPVLEFLLKTLNSKWNGKEITCYVVKHFRISGISHPLTLKMTRNVEEGLSNLIHELIHIFLPLKKWEKISQKLIKKFPGEKPEIILHIYVNFVHLQVLKKFFKKALVKRMLKKYKRFKRTGKAWEIVLREEKNLKKLLKIDPFLIFARI
jgi:hypothetical protein